MTKLISWIAIGLLAFGVSTFPAAAAQARDSFEAADANRDGVVSFEEARSIYPTLPQRLFRQADENHDGVLDESEYGTLLGLTAGFAIGG